MVLFSLEEIIFQSFKERLVTSKHPRMLFDMQTLIQPTPGLDELSTPFTKEEIDAVIKSLSIDKSPGPDGFNGQFLKSYSCPQKGGLTRCLIASW
jgi:hypothetical protein